MARSKATVMLDRDKVEAARAVTGVTSISDVLDVALDRVLRAAELRHDITAYGASPPTADELFGDLPVAFDLDDDDVDYEVLYGADS